MSRKTTLTYAFVLGALCLPGLSFADEFECIRVALPINGGSVADDGGGVGDAAVCGLENNAELDAAAIDSAAAAYGIGTDMLLPNEATIGESEDSRATNFGIDNSATIGDDSDNSAVATFGSDNIATVADGVTDGASAVALGVRNVVTAEDSLAVGIDSSVTATDGGGGAGAFALANGSSVLGLNADVEATGGLPRTLLQSLLAQARWALVPMS